MGGTAIGAIIGAWFGGLWGVAGASGLAPRARVPVAIAVVAVSTILTTALVMIAPHGGAFHGAIYGATVAIETVAIAAIAIPLNLRRRQDLLMPAIALVVGLHFIGLWRATGVPVFLPITAAMCGISLVGFWVSNGASGVSPRRMLVGFGCALVLWLSAAAVLI